MSPRIARAAICLALSSILLAACKQGGGLRGDLSVDQPGEVAGQTQVLAGTIRLVRNSLGFVLIQNFGASPPPGSELFVHRTSEGQPVATLRVSPETKTGFLVADILSGDPQAGDSVQWALPTASSARLSEAMPAPAGPQAIPSLPDAPMWIDPGPQRRIVPENRPVLAPEAELESEIRQGAGSTR